MVREHARVRVGGVLIGTGGLVAIVDGLLAAATNSWGSVQVLLPLVGGLALLGAMVWIEARSDAPLIPMRFFANRTRVVTNFVTLFFSSAFFSYFFLLTLFEQQVQGWSPLRGGLSYLPFGLTIGLGIGVGTALMPRLGVKPLLTAGFVGCAVGLLLSSSIAVGSTYAGSVLPGMVVLGLFSGVSFPAIGNAALHGVTGQDSSLASGVQNAMQQVGGAIGLSCLVTIALRYAASQVHDGVAPAVAATHGYALAFRIGAGLLVVGGVLMMALLERVSTTPRMAGVEVDEGAVAAASAEPAVVAA